MPTRSCKRIHCAPAFTLGLCVILIVAAGGCATTSANSGAVSLDFATAATAAPVTAGADPADASGGQDKLPAPESGDGEMIATASPANPAPETATGAPPEIEPVARGAGREQDAADTGVPTAAELDFDALYGPYDPVADPNLPAAAQMAGVYDPWERYNRSIHRFNNAVDRTVARPLARFYVAVAPRPVRLGVSNFFSNLGQPVSAINALLQGKPGQAGHAFGRFVVNTTLGIAGIFDPASDANLDRRSEDFGQTLGVWGWAQSRYVELPLFGPRTVRDVFGMAGDAPLSPLRQVEEDKVRVPLQGLQLVDVRTQLLATDSLREGVADDYALVRDAWLQRRNYQIFGDRMTEDTDESLPDYLRDDDNPLVPASTLPVMSTDN